MKNNLLLFGILIAIIGKASAQLPLAHKFNEYVYFGGTFATEPIDYYYTASSSSNTISIYNYNFSLYKTISVPNTVPNATGFSCYMIGKHLINTDDKIELFVMAYSDSGSHSYLLNEDGVIIHDFGDEYITSPNVIRVGNQLYLMTNGYNTPTSLYTCSGNYYGINTTQSENTQNNPYPNPTTNFINLPYQIEKGTISTMHIYNTNGQLVDSYNIGGDFEMITIDVNNYTKGIYVYEYNGISNKFVVQ